MNIKTVADFGVLFLVVVLRQPHWQRWQQVPVPLPVLVQGTYWYSVLCMY